MQSLLDCLGICEILILSLDCDIPILSAISNLHATLVTTLAPTETPELQKMVTPEPSGKQICGWVWATKPLQDLTPTI
jgi:hypothetical protein